MALDRGKRLRKMDSNTYQIIAKKQILSGVLIDESGCWKWQRVKQNNGYGQTRYLGRQTPAHRAAYLAFVGVIPDGMEVCHTCDVRDCVNPQHLYVATHASNMRDMHDKGNARGRLSSPGYIAERNADGTFAKQ